MRISDWSSDVCTSDLAAPFGEIAVAEKRNTGRDQRVRQVASRRNAQPLFLHPRAPALFGPEALVGERLIDQRRHRFPRAVRARLLDRDRDREMRDAVEGNGGDRKSTRLKSSK